MKEEHKLLDFFLRAQDEDDDFKFCLPPRNKTLVRPLIDGEATFRALEEAISKAKKTVDLALWSFDPSTPLQNKKHAPNWGDLLFKVAAKADVHIILSDFDPILQNDRHERLWLNYRKLVAEAKRRVSSDRRASFQVICSLHEATAEFAGWVALPERLDEIIKELNKKVEAEQLSADKRKALIRDMPGLWKNVEFVEKTQTFERTKQPDFTIYPASHHQKLCIVDGLIAFCGGLDIDWYRLDSQKHEGKYGGRVLHQGHGYWHDIQCQVEGDLAGDLERNFVSRWNREEETFRKFVTLMNSKSFPFKIEKFTTTPIASRTRQVKALVEAYDQPNLLRDLAETAASESITFNTVKEISRNRDYTGEVLVTLELTLELSVKTTFSNDKLDRILRRIGLLPKVVRAKRITLAPGKAFAQMHRTLSVHTAVPNPLGPLPNVVRQDIEAVYEKAIKQAQNFVYIENQYVRAPKLVDWLGSRRNKVPNLQVIIVLPVAPEELDKVDKVDKVTMHGLSIQYKVLSDLREAFGENLGLYSMVRRKKLNPNDKEDKERVSKTNSYQRPQVYVHSKCLIIDDVFASIGSPNFGLRSFRVDTELAVGWYDNPRGSDSVTKFRESLWTELLGSPPNIKAWKPKDYVKQWDKIANINARMKNSQMLPMGFIVPHDLKKFPGEHSYLIREEYT